MGDNPGPAPGPPLRPVPRLIIAWPLSLVASGPGSKSSRSTDVSCVALKLALPLPFLRPEPPLMLRIPYGTASIPLRF